MSSTSALLRTEPETVQDRLRGLLTGNRNTHWLTSGLRLQPSSETGRFFFTVVVKRLNTLRKLFFGIDLEEAKHTLIRIGWSQIDTRNYNDVRLFQKARRAFMAFAPNHPIPEMKGYYLERLISTFATNVFENLLQQPALPHHSLVSLGRERQNVGLPFNSIHECIRSFEKMGGHVHCLYPMSGRELDEGFKLRKSDDIAPVCHAGLVRSKIVKEAIEQKLKITTRLTHGVLTGYCGLMPTQNETDFCEYFEEAFLKKRTKRFGHGVPLEQLSQHFISNYWSRINHGGRVIFITFSNTFAHVIDQLKKHHPKLDQVHVLIIPDGDWISHYKGHRRSREAFYDLNISADRVAEVLRLHEHILLNNPSFEIDPYFVNCIRNARSDIGNPDIFYDFLQPYVYRYALYYYSQFFNLES